MARDTDWVLMYAQDHPEPNKRGKIGCERCGDMSPAPWGACISSFVAMTEGYRKLHAKCQPRPRRRCPHPA